MQIIHHANETIAKVWGTGKPQTTVYRLLTYIIQAEVSNGALLYNTVTGELVLLDKAETAQLSALPCDYMPWMDELIKRRFLVQAERDDRKSVETLRTALRMLNASKWITCYTILPTTHCNARCFYCYETGIKHETMSDETADKLVDFMAEHHGDKSIHIRWFGGEPLVGIRQIDRICKALQSRNIPFSSSMISNGYLFEEKIADRALKEWNLKNIQITLDGTEEVYNRIKNYVSPCPSPYRKVLDNIGILLQKNIHVEIRLNIGPHNADDLTVLVEELAVRFEDKTNLSVYASPLFDNCGPESARMNITQKELVYAQKNILDARLLELGFFRKYQLPKLKWNRCMADNNDSVVVVPSGMLGKCEHYAESHFAGSLDTGLTDQTELQCFRERVSFPECRLCPLYPPCIKLKLCETDHSCSKTMVQTDIQKLMHFMKRIYEDYLRNGKVQTESEETTDC